MSKYTSADFQTARFAKHHNGSVASRRSGALWPSPWLTAASESYSDSNMADNGWVPVPDQVPGPTMTASEMDRKCNIFGNEYLTGFTGAGGRVIPDPEPTNAEKWDAIVDEWRKTVSPYPSSASFGEWMDQRGVKAPNHD